MVTVIADGPLGQDSAGRPQQTRAVGSGIVISDDGHIVTNAHVIAGAASVVVVLATGEQRPAVLVADDSPYTDLAVIAVAPAGLRPAVWGDSAALAAGQPVIALAGSSFSLGQTVSVGVVAATGRQFPRPGVILHDLIQTDAAVNGGDSGGALLNLDGEVVGVLTTVVRGTQSGEVIQGVALAQSSATLEPIVAAVVDAGGFARPRLGIERPGTQHVELIPGDTDLATGARIVAVAAGSIGEASGLLADDVVVAVNGQPVDLDQPMVNLLGALAPGTAIDLTVMRGDQTLHITFPGLQE